MDFNGGSIDQAINALYLKIQDVKMSRSQDSSIDQVISALYVRFRGSPLHRISGSRIEELKARTVKKDSRSAFN